MGGGGGGMGGTAAGGSAGTEAAGNNNILSWFESIGQGHKTKIIWSTQDHKIMDIIMDIVQS